MEPESGICCIIVDGVKCQKVSKICYHTIPGEYFCNEHCFLVNSKYGYLSGYNYDSNNIEVKKSIKLRTQHGGTNSLGNFHECDLKYVLTERDTRIKILEEENKKVNENIYKTKKQLEEVETMLIYLSKQVELLKPTESIKTERVEIPDLIHF
jgi:hypothetical protein